MNEWIPKDSHKSGTMFVCPHCNEMVYFNHGSSSVSRRKSGTYKYCPYMFCPWCGEKVKQYISNDYTSIEKSKFGGQST